MKWTCLLLFGAFGLAAFVAGIAWGAKRIALIRGGLRTKGSVVEIYESTSTSNENGRSVSSTSYYPVVEFTAKDGRNYRFRGSTGSGAAEYEKGAVVNIVYDPANPSVAQITDFEQFWLGPLCISLFGFLFLVAGIGGFFLIAESDRTFGPEFEQRMAYAELYEGKLGIRLDAAVSEIRKLPGRDAPSYVIVCSGGAPGGTPRDFMSAPLGFDPGSQIVGRKVEVYVDPRDAGRYYVHVKALFEQVGK